ncbi:3 beta-hydroxysteroid dehydrogenase type 7, partial [Cichlidogyrus casuarinus]
MTDAFGCPADSPWPPKPFELDQYASIFIPLKTVLICGGAGFLGKHLIFNLCDSISELQVIRIVDRQKLPAAFRVPAAINKTGVQLEEYTGDLQNPDDIKDAFTNVDAVIHLAETSEASDRINENVLQMMKEHHVRILVYTSSAMCNRKWREVDNESEHEYDSVDDSEPLVLPSYGRSKLRSEWRIRALCREWKDLRALCLRPTGLYGEGDFICISMMLLKAKSNKGNMVQIGAGASPARIQRMYGGNCAWAHVLALRRMSLDSHSQ